MNENLINNIISAADIIKKSGYSVAFTGAGISVESGIPTFRGKDGLWSEYDPKILDLDYFHKEPKSSWYYIREIFYEHFSRANPNPAHNVLAWMEEKGLLESIITQNIDNLHQRGGSKNVIEFHGTSAHLICEHCDYNTTSEHIDFSQIPPKCPECKHVLKPDFIFFGEGIPTLAYDRSLRDMEKAECILVIGTTGEIVPASMLPSMAQRHGAKIIEINTETSAYTHTITDIFLQGKATEVLSELKKHLL